MSDRPSYHLDGLNIDVARRIDEACRRFEADLRRGSQPRIDDYLVDVSDEGRPALRAELEALERELRSPEETVVRPEAGAPTAPEPQTAPHPSTTAESPTIVPGPPPTSLRSNAPPSLVHQEATVPPGNPPRSPHEQPTAAALGHDPSAPPGASEPNRIRYFGDYEIVREIARGGMGVVFQARQVSLNRPVALKMILAGQLADDTDVKRFYTEAEAAANLDHPGIVPIFEVGQHEGQHYFSMGFVEGQSLSQRLAEGPLPAREAAELIRRVSEAIEYAHQHGVIHRDLKPANILLDQSGNPRVTDFGLAKKIQADSGLTGSGQIMGTPSYMPPEQAGGNRGDVGAAADVYALGATLYALLTGRPPFQAATPMDTVIQVLSDEPVPPRRLNAALPRDLETICLKCLEKEPAKRYATAAALGEDLGRYLAGEPIVARPVSRSERAVKWARRKPAIAALMALVALVAALGLAGVLSQWRAAVKARNVAQAREQDARNAQAKERVQTKLAKRQTELAKEQTELAEQRLRDTQKAQAEEKRQTELAEQRLYDVRMNLIQHYWEDNNGVLLQQGLDEQIPARQRGIDRRGFEWFYWQRKMSSGHITLKGHTDQITSVAFSPDGQRLASASGAAERMVKVWDLATGQETLLLSGHTGFISSVAFSPDGKRLASADVHGTIKVWNAATGKGILTFSAHTGQVNSVAFSPDGRRLASAGGPFNKPGEVKVWDAATGQATLILKRHTGQVNGVAFSPDGQRLGSASDDKTVIVWDAATGREIHTLKGHTDGLFGLAFSPHGERLASAGGDRTVKVWVAATGQEALILKGHTEFVTCVAFSPDGKRLASASNDRTVKLWDGGTGKVIPALMGHNGPVATVAFSPDGKRLASAGADQTVEVWDATIGQESLTLKGQTDLVSGVAHSPDGKRLASAGADGTVRVWDEATGQDTLTLKGHVGFVTNVAFSPDGNRLASAGEDRTVKVWDARPVVVVDTGPSMDDALHKLRMALTGEPRNPNAADHLKNPGFEAGLDGWETDVHGARPLIEFDANVVREGRQSLRVTATEPSDTAFGQEVMLKPGQAYRLLGWVRTRGLDPHGSPVFGTFQIQHTKGHDPYLIAAGTSHGKDTEWSEVAITFQAPAGGRTRICVFFVGFGKGTGTAWFDNLQLAEVNASPR